MSRRQVTTISVQVRLRIPPGSNAAEVLEVIRCAIKAYQKELAGEQPARPVASLDTNEMIVKLQEKKTTYL